MVSMSLGLLRALLITDPLLIIATAVMGTVSLIASILDPSGALAHRVARAWGRLLMRIMRVRLRVEGLDKLTGPSYVFAANHLSYMDTPVVISAIPLGFRFLAKKGLFKVPFIGGHLKRAGHIPVPRDDPRASVKTMAMAADIIRSRGVSILVFPEGGRSSDGLLQEFRDGAAYIAIKAGVPIVPLALEGTREVLPMGSINVRGGDVVLRVGDPIPTADLRISDRSQLTKKVHERVADLLNEPSAIIS